MRENHQRYQTYHFAFAFWFILCLLPFSFVSALFASICISRNLEILPFATAVCDDDIRWWSVVTLYDGGVQRCLFASIFISRKLETLLFATTVCDDGVQRWFVSTLCNDGGLWWRATSLLQTTAIVGPPKAPFFCVILHLLRSQHT